MACLDNYILVKGYCGSSTPSTGLYINSNLPGITLRKASNTAEDTVTTGVELLNQCITNGIIKARQDLISAMMSTVRFNSVIGSGEFGYYDPDWIVDAEKFLTSTATGRGVKIELKNNCRLSSIYIKRVRVIGGGTGTMTLTITDGVTLTTKTFTAVNDTPVDVEINQKIESNLAYITLADSGFEPLDTLLNYSGTCGFCANDCTHTHSCSRSNGLNIYGWDGTSEGSQTFGLIPTIHNICDQEKFFCEISQVGSIPQLVLYAAGIIFLNEMEQTDRLNYFTIYKEDRRQELKEEWKETYTNLLNTIVNQLPKYLNTIDSCCLDCNANTYSYGIP